VSAVRLKEVASFIRGITFKPNDVVPLGTPGVVQCMRTKNVQSELDLSDVWAVDSGFVKRGEQYLEEGDLLISSANSWNLVGKCSWVPGLNERATFGGFVTVLRGDGDLVDRRYLYRWFSMSRTQETIRSFSRQTTNIANLDLKRCAELVIPLPPLVEQKRIATVLDQVDDLRAKRREAIALLDDLAQSVFLDMFGDPVSNPKGLRQIPLTDACTAYSGGTPSKADPANWGGGLPWFSAKDLKKSDLFSSQDTINPDVPKSTNLKLLPAGTVTIVVRGMILAHSFPVCVIRVPATINQDLKALVPKVELNSQFLAYCLRAQKNHALSQVSQAAHGTTRIDSDGLANIKVLLPATGQQQGFARRIQEVQTIKQGHEGHLAALDDLFASLQQRAFSGTLWDHEAAA
jgi:type I restriction enzyme S subunit